MKYARIVEGRVVDPVVIPAQLPPWAQNDAEYLARIFPGVTGFIVVPDNTQPGAADNGDGTYTNPQAPSDPGPQFAPTISRIRFDAVFAAAIGEVTYDDVLDTMAGIAATTPKTAQSVAVKRALRALDSATAGIDRPLTDWRTPLDHDLTAQFLKLCHDVMVGADQYIGDKIDTGLAAWPKV